MESSDIGAVKVLVSGLEGGVALLGDIQKYVEGRRDSLEDGATPLFAAVAECVGQVVGVAVLRQEEVCGTSVKSGGMTSGTPDKQDTPY